MHDLAKLLTNLKPLPTETLTTSFLCSFKLLLNIAFGHTNFNLLQIYFQNAILSCRNNKLEFYNLSLVWLGVILQ